MPSIRRSRTSWNTTRKPSRVYTSIQMRARARSLSPTTYSNYSNLERPSIFRSREEGQKSLLPISRYPLWPEFLHSLRHFSLNNPPKILISKSASKIVFIFFIERQRLIKRSRKINLKNCFDGTKMFYDRTSDIYYESLRGKRTRAQ